MPHYDEPPSDPPPTLNYQPVKTVYDRTPKWLQAVVGFVAWIAFISIVAGANRAFGNSRAVSVLLVLGIATLVVLDIRLRRRYGWTAFTPGVAIAMGLSCLVPVIGIGIACGFFK